MVVSGHYHAEHFLEILRHRYLHELACGDQCPIDGSDPRHLPAPVKQGVLPFPGYGAHEPLGKGIVD